jgi:Golgi phosphoprotein 3 (GPP34)
MGHSDYAPSIFLTAHDPFTGRLEIPQSPFVCALAAAELAHLIVDRRLRLAGGQFVPADLLPDRDVKADALSADGPYRAIDDYVVDRVSRQDAANAVEDVIGAIGSPLYETIADTLVQDGTVRRSEQRRTGGPQFPAVNVLVASGPRLRLNQVIREPRAATLAAAVNIALICALGLENLLEVEISRAFREELHHNLPSQLRILVAGAARAAA